MAKTANFLTATALTMLVAAPLALAAGPTPTPNADPTFGMPKDVAAAAKERCGKLTSYYSSQALCMQWEAQGYAKLNPSQGGDSVAYNINAESAKASARAAEKHPGAVAVCPPPHRMTEKDGCR